MGDGPELALARQAGSFRFSRYHPGDSKPLFAAFPDGERFPLRLKTLYATASAISLPKTSLMKCILSCK